jgi:hypothetical protein
MISIGSKRLVGIVVKPDFRENLRQNLPIKKEQICRPLSHAVLSNLGDWGQLEP